MSDQKNPPAKPNPIAQELSELRNLLIRYQAAYKEKKAAIQRYNPNDPNTDEPVTPTKHNWQQKIDKQVGKAIDDNILPENANDGKLKKAAKEAVRDKIKEKAKVENLIARATAFLKEVEVADKPILVKEAEARFTALRDASVQHKNDKHKLEQEVVAAAEAVAKCKITYDNLQEGFKFFAQAGILSEANWELKEEWKTKLGKVGYKLEAKAKLIDAKATAVIKAFDLKKLQLLDIDLSVFAEAEAKVKASFNYNVKTPLGEFGLDLEAEALARAEAGIGGKLKIGATGIEAKFGGSAMVFAGVKAGGEIVYKTTQGEVIMRLRGTVAAGVGAGVSFGGKFKFRNGVLSIALNCGLAAGAGASADTEIEIDFKVLGREILRAIKKLFDKIFGIGKKRVKKLSKKKELLQGKLSFMPTWPKEVQEPLDKADALLATMQAEIDQKQKPDKLRHQLKEVRRLFVAAVDALDKAVEAQRSKLTAEQQAEYAAFVAKMPKKWRKATED